jgi:hypothetical protein
MTELNKYEQYVIGCALELWQEQFEKEITEATAEGKRVIYDISYPGMITNDIKNKLNVLVESELI